MEEIEVIFDRFRDEIKSAMLSEGIEPTAEAKVKFYKELIEELRGEQDFPVLVKRMMIVILEYEIELLETMPDPQYI